MTIVLGSDHAGYELKKVVEKYLNEKGIDTVDVGCDSTDPVDYPIYGKAAGEAVVSGKGDKGIVICGTGIGISIAANKVHGVRCALCTSVEMAQKSREHNNANLLAMGARTTKEKLALEIVDAWLETEFLGGHHAHRVDMLNEM